MASLKKSLKVCRINAGEANRLESDRFQNSDNLLCPVWNGHDQVSSWKKKAKAVTPRPVSHTWSASCGTDHNKRRFRHSNIDVVANDYCRRSGNTVAAWIGIWEQLWRPEVDNWSCTWVQKNDLALWYLSARNHWQSDTGPAAKCWSFKAKLAGAWAFLSICQRCCCAGVHQPRTGP